MPPEKLPNFLILGAQKSGTTTLFKSLIDNADIGIPACKEVHFFDSDENYQKGMEFYKANFSGIAAKAVGEATPSYLYMPKCAERIFESLGPETKLIVALRHPIDRAYSHYCHSVEKGFEFKSWDEAIALEESRIEKDDKNRIIYSYLDRGRYARDIKRYLRLFKRENFLFLLYEQDIRKNLPTTIQKIDRFLGVPRSDEVKVHFENKGTAPKSASFDRLLRDPDHALGKQVRHYLRLAMPVKLRNALGNKLVRMNQGAKLALAAAERDRLYQQYFEAERAELESLTGLDLSVWRAPAPAASPKAAASVPAPQNAQ